MRTGTPAGVVHVFRRRYLDDAGEWRVRTACGKGIPAKRRQWTRRPSFVRCEDCRAASIEEPRTA